VRIHRRLKQLKHFPAVPETVGKCDALIIFRIVGLRRRAFPAVRSFPTHSRITAMLFHASFPARDPRWAAEAVARLWGGQAFPFPVFNGSYIVIEGDTFGSAIEFCPSGQVLVAGADDAEAERQRPAGPSETHLAISTKLIEVLTAEMQKEYTAFMTPKNYAAFMETMSRAA
jgi:hypothetical protein